MYYELKSQFSSAGLSEISEGNEKIVRVLLLLTTLFMNEDRLLFESVHVEEYVGSVNIIYEE